MTITYIKVTGGHISCRANDTGISTEKASTVEVGSDDAAMETRKHAIKSETA